MPYFKCSRCGLLCMALQAAFSVRVSLLLVSARGLRLRRREHAVMLRVHAELNAYHSDRYRHVDSC
eukprot:15482-Heterococcus_DN1.PRE.1